MNTLRTLACILLLASSQALANGPWLSLDMELSDKLRLGATHPFDVAHLVFDDGIQIVNTNDKPTAVSTGAAPAAPTARVPVSLPPRQPAAPSSAGARTQEVENRRKELAARASIGDRAAAEALLFERFKGSLAAVAG